MERAILRVFDGGGESAATAVQGPLPLLRLPALGLDDQVLIERLRVSGVVAPTAIAAARAGLLSRGVPLAEGLLALQAIGAEMLADEQAAALGWGRAHGPLAADSRLLDRLRPDLWLSRALVPLGRQGGTTVIAAARPEAARDAAPLLERFLGPVRFLLATRPQVEAALLRYRRTTLTERAETTVPHHESCRGWSEPALKRAGIAAVVLLATAAAAAPLTTFAAATFLALALLAATTALKIAALFATLTRRRDTAALRPAQQPPRILPRISVLVPLFREREIADRLVRRLWALDYPRDRLEICLVLEEDDSVTREALTRFPLPPWFRLIEVPRGSVKTKPRALNYALPFCRGEIVGIYDAEDEPEPDQLARVAERFATAPPEIACLQGALDYYNATDNWLARCFTIEYASWFRVMLPGIARLGLVVPLGGTTLFVRRRVLEKLGGWDAHNVTEDADLGLRLARHGYVTELLPSVTREEANCHAWPWVRQRSRWLKGYAMTWAAHMRSPRRLWRELGPMRFLGVQVLFLGAFVPLALSPLLWSFWAIPLGYHHPLAPLLGPHGLAALTVLFLACEVLNLTVGIIAVRIAGHRRLTWWVPLMHLYFPLGAIAAWKGLIEIATRPYYWDKTAHGLSPEPAC
jgi:cellulose synthase/poly-beta-1,6-N-acetylglucosamine synthase-like glycosyltransferase